jgi:hypothetical protein
MVHFYLVPISHNNQKIQRTFRDFRHENVQIKSVDSVSVLWGSGATALVAPP